MSTVFFPLALLLDVLAGWINDRQSRVLEFLQEEKRIRRRQPGKKCLRLTDDERRSLAAKGVHLGRKLVADGLVDLQPAASPSARVSCRARLGAILNYYFRRAA